MSDRETSAEIDAVAAKWAVRVDDAPLDAQEQADLDDWLAGDVRRLGAFTRACAVLAHVKRGKALGASFDPDAFLFMNRKQSEEGGRLAIERVLKRQVGRRALLVGGAVALSAGVVTFGFGGRATAQTFSTRRGEIRLLPLPDGSTMTLNTASTAKVQFTEVERHVELVEGEALFDVARETARPFVVSAGDMTMRAGATIFTVKRLEDRPVQVLIRQGVVDISGPAEQYPIANRVSENSRVVLGKAEPATITQVAPAEVSRLLAWREGMLSFEGQPLRAAADEFARYSDVKITFADPEIGNETVTGLFAANNPVGFAKSVALSLGLQADAGASQVTLRRRIN